MSDHATDPPGFTFRRCLLLCLPALIFGAVLRISFLVAVPPAFYGSDSHSYFHTAEKLWNHGEFKNAPKRRYLYPLFLAGAAGVPGNPANLAAAIQHGVGLVTILGIGWIAGQLTRRPNVWVPIVTIVAAAWPRMLWFEHEMIAEVFVLAAFVLTVALALPLQRLRTPKGLLFFLLSAALIISFKPHGRPIWIVLVILGAAFSWRHLRWNWKHYATVAGSLVILGTGGSESQGGWLLLSSTLPLVKTEGTPWPEYRALLKPHIEAAREDLPNYASNQGRFKKPIGVQNNSSPLGPEWAKLSNDRKKYASVTKRLAIDAILANPFTYARMVIQKILLVFSDDAAGAHIGPVAFWDKQTDSLDDRWESRPKEMGLVYGTDYAGYQRLKENSLARTLWYEPFIEPVSRAATWVIYKPGSPGNPPLIQLRWPAYLLIFGFLSCLIPGRFQQTCIAWLPAVIYCGLIFSVGDAVRRYMHPVDWCWLVVIALGLDAICDHVSRLIAKFRPVTQSIPL